MIQKHLEVYGSTTKMNQIITLANSESFKFKVKIAGKTPAGGNTKNVKLIAIYGELLKCHSLIVKVVY